MYAVHGYYAADVGSSPVDDNAGFYMDTALDVADKNDLPAKMSYGASLRDAAVTSNQVFQAVNPKQYGIGRARIEASAAGSTLNGGSPYWWTVTGNTVPDAHDLRVSNGAIRAAPSPDGPHIGIEIWDYTNLVWVGFARIELEINAGGTLGHFARRWHVLRNDHAEIVVRCYWMRDSATNNRYFPVDIVLSAGAPVVKIAVSHPTGQNVAWAATMEEYAGTGMATETLASTDGIRRTATVTTGQTPYLFGLDASSTVSATTDSVNVASASSFRFGVTSRYGLTYADAAAFWRTDLFANDRLVY